MGVHQKPDLSNAGQLLLSMISLVDSLVPDIVHEIDADYDKKNIADKKDIETRARNIATKILTGLMKP
jgi:hypothetical protein